MNDVRTLIVKLRTEPARSTPDISADTSSQIDVITDLVDQLARLASNSTEARVLADRIRDGLDKLKRHLGG